MGYGVQSLPGQQDSGAPEGAPPPRPCWWAPEDLLSYLFFFFFNLLNFIYLFIDGCVGSSFLCEGFLQLGQAGATPHRGARASHYRGLSCCGAQAPDAQAQ